MRRLLAVVPLFTLAGCAFFDIMGSPAGPTPSNTFGGKSITQPVVIRIGEKESEPLKSPETEESAPSKEASTAEASDAPGATQ
ncbi:hypothetical protein JYK02_26220 [Corallococcus macrosporus]|uniref:Uncharacterized protein n=1 Tax=Corallococcus macrosporus TaxID=35 RepID=A0ABS3DI95_9BACT|nr:hypothetical protein [Corallococcus macrosporus]MBN8231020.1 hypothetical protein [Corallococcus macrosporus]